MWFTNEALALMYWERYLPVDGVPKWYAAIKVSDDSRSSSTMLMACSSDVMAVMQKMG